MVFNITSLQWFLYGTLYYGNTVLFADSDFFAAIALELSEEPYELVTVRESRGRHKRSLQAPLPEQLNVEFTLQHSTVKLRLRRNTRMQRQIPVIFEEEPEKVIYVSMEEVTIGYTHADNQFMFSQFQICHILQLTTNDIFWFMNYGHFHWFAVAPHRRNAKLRWMTV